MRIYRHPYPHCFGLYFWPPPVTVVTNVNYWTYFQTAPRFMLQSVSVEAKLVDIVTEVTITQRFFNTSLTQSEAVYLFPLDERAAVSAFEAEIGDRTVVAEIKEKQQAKQEYAAAVAEGHGAYLLEEARDDVFQMKIGNILPGQQVVVRITYVAEVAVDEDAVSFFLPTHVAPRYTPYGSEPIPSGPSGVAPGGLTLSLDCEMRSDITRVSCEKLRLETVMDGTKNCAVKFHQGAVALDGDIVILVHLAEPHQPRITLEKNETGNERACMVSLVPNFELDDVRCEIIFLVDRSGSMGGSKITQTREALELFLRSLPADCYFNIVGFGSRYEVLFPRGSEKYSQTSLDTASKHVRALAANLGGTEIVQPLKAVSALPRYPGYSRQVMVLTDGEVSNADEVFATVRTGSTHSRFFCLGIGSDVSHHLVEGIARAGLGTAEFALKGDRLQTKVIRQLKDAMQPCISDVTVDWGIVEEFPAAQPSSQPKSLLGFKKPDTTSRSLLQAPFVVPPVFSGDRFVVYCLLKENIPSPTVVTIRANSPEGPLEVVLPIAADEIYTGDIVQRLAARALIRDLEEGVSCVHKADGTPFKPATAEQARQYAIKTALQYKLVSKNTSFLAIERRHGAVPAPVQVRQYVMPQPVTVPVMRPGSADRRVLAAAAAPRSFGGGVSSFLNMAKGIVTPQSSASGDLSKKRSKSSSTLSYSAPSASTSSFSGGAVRGGRGYISGGGDRSRGEDRSASWADDAMECEEEFVAPSSVEREKSRSRSISPASSATVAATSTPSLTLLISLQNFEGFFECSDTLATVVGLGGGLAGVLSSVPGDLTTQLGQNATKIWATCLALAFLDVRLGSLKEDWELVAAKSTAAVKRALKGTSFDIPHLLTLAKSIL